MFIKLDKLRQAKNEPDFMQIGNILSCSSHCALHVCCVCVRTCVFSFRLPVLSAVPSYTYTQQTEADTPTQRGTFAWPGRRTCRIRNA